MHMGEDLVKIEDEEPGEVSESRVKIGGYFKGLYQMLKNIFTEGNTLSISPEQNALAHADSYAKIRARIKMNTIIGIEYLVMNALGTVIAACGLATNSMLTLFGASAIAMLLEPVMGASLAIVESDRKLLVQALYAEIFGVLTVIVTAFVFALFYRFHITNSPESSLVQYATPSLLDLLMAIACGAACAYSALSRKVRIGLTGIALSITLLPPLAACGIFMAHANFSYAVGAIFAFLANFIGIQFTASIVFWLHGFHSDMTGELNFVKIVKKNIISIMLIVFLAIILGLNLKHILDKQQYEQEVKITLKSSLSKFPATDLAEVSIGHDNVITAVVRSSVDLSPKQVKSIAMHLPVHSGQRPELHLRVVKVHEVQV